MSLFVNPPPDGFQAIRNYEIYVDKSGLILYTNRVMNTPMGLICFSRPRRFGKSFSAKMLAAYYVRGFDTAALFDDLQAAKEDPELYRRHRNQYDVLFLDISFFLSRASTPAAALNDLQSSVIRELRQLYPAYVEPQTDVLFDAMAQAAAGSGQKFYVVIDEWDAFFREAKEDEVLQKEYIRLLRNLFKSSQTPQVIAGAYMTGILPIKKYGTQSALTDFKEYTMLSAGPLAPYAGFTEDEVKDLCSRTWLNFEDTKKWYDGYRLDGEAHVYNPNSIVEAISRRRLDSYWTQTETYDSLRVYIDMNYDGLKDGIVEMLGGKSCRVNTRGFQNDMTSVTCRDDIYTLLVHLGYLSYNADTKSVFIPNEEIREEFISAIQMGKRTELVKAVQLSDRLLKATLRMDEETCAELIGEAHLSNTSPKNYNNEQALRSVILMAYLSCVDDYHRFEELAGGRGYSDILFLPVPASGKPALLVELKWNKSADAGVAQILDRGYARAVKQFGYEGEILLVGINYSTRTGEHTCRIQKLSSGKDAD